MVVKNEKKVKCWCYKWFSRVGRLTLIKSVLMVIPVFWALFSWMSRGILEHIRKICHKFLWAGSKEDHSLSWVAWEKIAQPKEWGGWGIKELPSFVKSLAAKMGWSLLNKDSLWFMVMRRKYIDPGDIVDWVWNPVMSTKGGSAVWRATLQAMDLIEEGLAWKVGNGQ